MTAAMFLDDIQLAPRARRTDPSTSHAAAQRATAFAESHAGRILAALKLHGPRSAHSLSLLIGLSVVQIDRRLPDLKAQGLAVPTDEVDSGCRIWRALAPLTP